MTETKIDASQAADLFKRNIKEIAKPANCNVDELKFMTLKEAYDKANDDDELVCKTDKMTISGIKKNIVESNLFEMPFKGQISNEWRIIPPEPKVLSAGESWDKTKNLVSEEFTHRKDVYTIGFEDGDQSGQLEQWLNHEPLRDAAGKVFKKMSGDKNPDYLEVASLVHDMYIFLKNLKSLKAE